MKKVSFTEERDQIVARDEQGMTSQEAALLFYSARELAGIMDHCKSVVSGRVKDDCTRGLELMNNNNKGQRNYHKILVSQVLKEQNRQRRLECSSAEELAKVSEEFSGERQKLALALGKQDAKDAREGVWQRIIKRTSLRSSFQGTKVTADPSKKQGGQQHPRRTILIKSHGRPNTSVVPPTRT